MSKGRHIGKRKKRTPPHCEVCGSPLRRRNGRLVCDYCQRPVA